ncbi:hypothetical protein IU474_13460 [Nocardia otitidiscaviarum]|nr:hypothetical protein [Nocardia otitidiscaviarum]MBF6238070.1 hypothetical protein [Nocardia otitidiscaviarum]
MVEHHQGRDRALRHAQGLGDRHTGAGCRARDRVTGLDDRVDTQGTFDVAEIHGQDDRYRQAAMGAQPLRATAGGEEGGEGIVVALAGRSPVATGGGFDQGGIDGASGGVGAVGVVGVVHARSSPFREDHVQEGPQCRVDQAVERRHAVGALAAGQQLALSGAVAIVGQRAVGVEVAQDLVAHPRKIVRGHLAGGVGQHSFGRFAIGPFHRVWNPLHHLHDLAGVVGGDLPIGLGTCGIRQFDFTVESGEQVESTQFLGHAVAGIGVGPGDTQGLDEEFPGARNTGPFAQ